MNDSFNEWYINANIFLQAAQVELRKEVIRGYLKTISLNKIVTLIRMYFGLEVSDSDQSSFAVHFAESDPSFSVSNNREVALLAGIVLVEISEKKSKYSCLTEMLTITASFGQEPVCSPDILNTIKKQFDNHRVNIREQESKKQAPILNKSILSEFEKQMTDSPWDKDSPAKLAAVLHEFQNALCSIQDEVAKSQHMQSIYREDSQLLWWMQAKWCNTLNCPLKVIDKSSACLMLGWEAASFVVNYPGPYSIEGVLNDLIDSCSGVGENVSITEIVTKVDKILSLRIIEQANALQLLDLLPLCKAIISASNTEGLQEWYPRFKREFLKFASDPTMPLHDFSMEMYLEGMVISCLKNIGN